MILLEKFPCKDIFEATRQERVWCEKLKANLNSQVPAQTKQEYNKVFQKEYYHENRERILKYSKEYRETHTEQILEYRQTHKEKLKDKINCICGSVCGKSDIRRHEKTTKHIKYLEQQK